MNKMKAVVLEKSGTSYTVLDQDGTFRQVYRRLDAEVGEEIEIRTGIDIFGGLRIWAGAAAVFLLALATLLSWTLYQAPTAVALLSVDINPSLQFEIDKKGYLLDFQTQNEDAKRMLSQIDLKRKPIEEVLEQIVTLAYEQKFLSPEQLWVVVGYSPMPNKTVEQMPKELNENQIISWVTEIGAQKGLTPQVAVFPLTSQERELAQKGDLTLGEYALWQTADKAGVVTQPEKLKDTSERVRLLENPKVQGQIEAEKNKRRSVVPQTSGISKKDSGSIGNSGEDRTGKHSPSEKLFSSIKIIDPWIDKSRSTDEDRQQPMNQNKDKYMLKNTDKNNDYLRKFQDKYPHMQKNENNDNNVDKQRGIEQERDQVDQKKSLDKDQEDQEKSLDKDQKEQRRDQVEDEETDQGKDKDKGLEDQEDQKRDRQKSLDTDKYKDRYQTKYSEDNETQQSKYNKTLVPQIWTSNNLRRGVADPFRFSEYDWDKQQRS